MLLIWLMVIGVELEEPALRPVTALYIIAVPLIDMASVIMRRIKSGQSPFLADRQHLHHLLEFSGFSHKRSLIVISVAASILAIIGCLAEVYLVSEWVMLVFFLALFVSYRELTTRAWKKSAQTARANCLILPVMGVSWAV